MGIKKEIQANLFKVFNQIIQNETAQSVSKLSCSSDNLDRQNSQSKADQTSGHGLGLYLSQMLACKFGGNIQVDSLVGTGTSVIINLPVTFEENHSEINDQDPSNQSPLNMLVLEARRRSMRKQSIDHETGKSSSQQSSILGQNKRPKVEKKDTSRILLNENSLEFTDPNYEKMEKYHSEIEKQISEQMERRMLNIRIKRESQFSRLNHERRSNIDELNISN